VFHGAIQKIKVARFYGPRCIEGGTVLNSSLARAKNKEYLTVVFKH